jgi:hypothetical protein
MKNTLLLALLVGGFHTVLLAQGGAVAQVTITEPARYNIAHLFEKADVVASVRIVSGDIESYNMAIYKAEVIHGFKGASSGQILYFGPFQGSELGSEYVVFLRNVQEPAIPKASPNAAYGTVRYREVFDQGYGSMLTSYECVFEGKDVAQQCDYGVRVCTDYIVLPKQILLFPQRSKKRHSGAGGCVNPNSTCF